MIIIQWCISLAIALGLFLISIFSIECVTAALPQWRRRKRGDSTRPSVAVLIPAHNEQVGIKETLATVVPQLQSGDQVLVVADNCTDYTAKAARDAGAEVIERSNQEKRGKGYALDFGVRTLEKGTHPDVVIVIDADCRVKENTIDELARAAGRSNRPAQCINLLSPPSSPSPNHLVSAFAFRVKNWVRPLGLHRLGMPCLLSTGTAFPWKIIQTAPLASANIVEDMQMGIDLTLAGHPPVFCPYAGITGVLPGQNSAVLTQRTRWEHGHMRTILTQVPRMFIRGIFTANIGALALACELAIPPLSLLVAFWFVLTFSVIGECIGLRIIQPLEFMGIGWALLIGALFLAWARYGRDLLSLHVLLLIPVYVIHKMPLYKAFLGKRQQSWVRTARDHESGPLLPAQLIVEKVVTSAGELGVHEDIDVPIAPSTIRTGQGNLSAKK
ncbi:MAG TPA: glycosyltransferase family 2 protein [Tepidisphaeraceae bacterium]|jgi:cellulose synthase/poly-beta-1,6-N-acetylglucosamine synthase-like glycosyltransferase